MYLFWWRRFFFSLVLLCLFSRREIAMNKIFDDDSALNERNKNKCFSSAIQAKDLDAFCAKSIEPQSTLGYFVLEILTLFSFVFTLALICSLSKRPRHCKRKELNTSLHTHFDFKMCERLTHICIILYLQLNQSRFAKRGLITADRRYSFALIALFLHNCSISVFGRKLTFLIQWYRLASQ